MEDSNESNIENKHDGQQVTIPLKMIGTPPETPPEQIPPGGDPVGCDGAMNGAVTQESNPPRLDDEPVFLQDKHENSKGGCDNLAFVHDDDQKVKFHQPNLEYGDMGITYNDYCNHTRRTVVIIMVVMLCIFIAIVFFMIGHMTGMIVLVLLPSKPLDYNCFSPPRSKGELARVEIVDMND